MVEVIIVDASVGIAVGVCVGSLVDWRPHNKAELRMVKNKKGLFSRLVESHAQNAAIQKEWHRSTTNSPVWGWLK